VFGRLSLGLSAALFLCATSAMAQPEPDGTFTESCQNIQVRNGDLRAQCRAVNGSLNWTTLDDYEQCDGDIANLNGELVCRGGADDRGRDRDNDRDRDGSRGSLPDGSYRQSCRDIRTDDGDLFAECRDRQGRYQDSELENYRRCDGEIVNDDGDLRCERDDDDDRDLPRGSWRDSCRDYDVSRGVLTAECRNRAGRWLDARLDLRNCRQDVVNDNGRLVCGAPVVRNRITLYRNVAYGGANRSFAGDTPDLGRYGFNDVASSAAVSSGRWQLCTRSYYRGRCVVIDRNTSNFTRIGMNDRVRSLRALRR
jgi:hypothetical protein